MNSNIRDFSRHAPGQPRGMRGDDGGKTVLVTGASGFFGREAVSLLAARGFVVHACARRPLDLPDVRWHAVDLLNPAERVALIAAVRPSHLLHLAWDVLPGYWFSDANHAWLAASLDLARLFRDSGGRRLVGAGTCAEYDWRAIGHEPLNERTTPLAPHTPYGCAKLAVCNGFSDLADGGVLSMAWARLFLCYGPREHPSRLVSGTIINLLAGLPAPSTEGTQQRDLMHSKDIAAALVALLDSPVEGAVNIGTGQAIAVRDVMLTLGRLCDRPELIQLGALPMRADDPPLLLADNFRLTREVGFDPAFGLESGLADAVAWWRHHGAAPPPASEERGGVRDEAYSCA